MAVLGLEKYRRRNPFKTQISIETLPEGTETESETVSDEFDCTDVFVTRKAKRNHSPLKKRLFGKFDSPLKRTEMDAEVGSILGFKRGRNRLMMPLGAGKFLERLKKRNVKKELRKIQKIENIALAKILTIKKTENKGSPGPGPLRVIKVKVDDKDTIERKAKKAMYKTFARFQGVNAPLMKNANVISKDEITAHKRPKFKTLSPTRFQRFMPSIHEFSHPGRHNEAKPIKGSKRPDYLEAIIIRREIQDRRKSKDRMQQKLTMFQKFLNEARSK